MEPQLEESQDTNPWTADRINAEIAKYTWYHRIDLGHGIVTPGREYSDLWDMIRRTRAHVDYAGKRVLDVASWDGMWAFEAERLGAATVVASEVQYAAYSTFLLCRDIRRSKVIPYYNCSCYQLYERLDDFLLESNPVGAGPDARYFDIVQNFGLLYHLRDPFYAMSQVRSVLKRGGKAIFETAVILDDDDSYMLHNGYPHQEPRVYPDASTWWAMTVPCFLEMINASLFRVLPETLETIHQFDVKGRKIGRASVVAEAVGISEFPWEFCGELLIPYRTPGMHLGPGRY